MYGGAAPATKAVRLGQFKLKADAAENRLRAPNTDDIQLVNNQQVRSICQLFR